MGGPIDEANPTVLEINPANNSVNVKPTEIFIIFDEYIKLENPSKNIIITPKLNKDELEIIGLKNTVKIVLNQELEDSTTYVFNFQKAIEDLSEGNPVENLKLVFSTGQTIDSLSLTGKINFSFSKGQEEYKDVLVGLYPILDSLDGFKTAPYYISQIDTAGQYLINNIKPGQYKAFAWEDKNSNLKADSKSENFDFLLDTIKISQNIDNLNFNLSKGDQTPIKLIRSSPNSKQYDLILNRQPVDTKVSHEEIGKNIFYTVNADKRLKLYSTKTYTDSLPVRFELQDSVGFSIDTTLFAKFQESERKPEKLTITGNTGKNFHSEIPIELKFNKPILKLNFDSLYISYDTASIIPITDKMVSFTDSTQRTKINIKVKIDPSLPFDLFTIKAAHSTFIDIEGQTNDKPFLGNYRKLKEASLSDGISGKIEGGNGPFIVELINSKNEAAYEIYLETTNTYKFNLIEPGTYQIRVISDSNKNRRWDPSNFIQKRYAEQVSYFEDPTTKKREITIRGGWTLEDQNIQIFQKTGIKIQ
jgi:uncharacterized protein (DUF2141 family)